MDYRKTEICDPIIAAHRHHCYVPPEVWEIDAATVCGVCQAKNASLISALVQKIPVEAPQPIAVSVKPPVISIKALDDKYPKPLCQTCGNVRLRVSHWDDGQRECSECKNHKHSDKRICRFCLREVSATGYRIKDQMCTRNECWEKFNAEWNEEKAAAS